jgi:uncharacterized membrane protein YkoI
MARSSARVHNRAMTKTLPLMTALVTMLAIGAFAQETKIQMKDLPKAVQAAAEQERAKGATLKGFNKEVEGGKTFYEVETVLNGRTRDLLFDPSGTVVEVEEEIATDAVPPAAMKALMARGKVTKVETVTKGKSVVAYESTVKTKTGKNVEVAVDAAGKPVKP